MVSQIKAREPQADGPGGYADESALVAGLRAGRPEAYEALHAAYATSIYNLALRIVDDPHEAQDVTQEVVIKVLRGLPKDEGDFTLPAWLYRVTANAAFDHLRARKRRPVTVAADVAPEPACQVDEYERAELSRRVEATLKELPKRQQVALVLRDVHGMSVGETASVLGVTKGSADVLLSRARSGFRKVFLASSAAGGGRCAEAERILAGSVGGGVSAADRALLAEHTRTCPDCGRTVALWGAAPVGLGLLLPQVALPAKLSFGATLAAAQAAGVALPAGLGAAAAAGASAAGATGSAAATAAAATSAAAPAATAAGGAGLLAALGSAAGIKVATLAAVATAAVGIAGVATHERVQQRTTPDVTPAALVQGPGGASGAGAGVSAGDHGRAGLLAAAHHRDGAGGEGRGGDGGRAAGATGHQGSQAKGGDGSGNHADGHADGGAAGSAGDGEGGSAYNGSGAAGGSSHEGDTGSATGGSTGGGSTGGSSEGGSGGDGTDASHTGSGAGTGTGTGVGGDSGSHSGGD
jgi:RNA polymerase sigma factor (sigma-70 family)